MRWLAVLVGLVLAGAGYAQDLQLLGIRGDLHGTTADPTARSWFAGLADPHRAAVSGSWQPAWGDLVTVHDAGFDPLVDGLAFGQYDAGRDLGAHACWHTVGFIADVHRTVTHGTGATASWFPLASEIRTQGRSLHALSTDRASEVKALVGTVKASPTAGVPGDFLARWIGYQVMLSGPDYQATLTEIAGHLDAGQLPVVGVRFKSGDQKMLHAQLVHAVLEFSHRWLVLVYDPSIGYTDDGQVGRSFYVYDPAEAKIDASAGPFASYLRNMKVIWPR